MRVKKATVEIVRPNKLKVGDKILWSGFVGTIQEIKPNVLSGEYFGFIDGVPDDEGYVHIKKYAFFYKVTEFTEQKICQFCMKDLENDEKCNCTELMDERWEEV